MDSSRQESSATGRCERAIDELSPALPGLLLALGTYLLSRVNSSTALRSDRGRTTWLRPGSAGAPGAASSQVTTAAGPQRQAED